MAALVILVVIALLAGLVAVVTSVLGIPITIRRQAQEPTEPVPQPTAAGTRGPARATARLLLAVVVISATGAVLATLALRWLRTLLERLAG